MPFNVPDAYLLTEEDFIPTSEPVKLKEEMSYEEYQQALRDDGCYDDGFYDEV